MDPHDRYGSQLDRPWDQATAPAGDRASVSSSVGLQLASSDGHQFSVTRLVSEAESLIRRYPWPTLMLGMGAGFLLARRVR